MARKKNLERAIVLGLILSTGVYGSAFAINRIVDDYDQTFDSSITVEGANSSAIEIDDKEVKITTTDNTDGTIKLDSNKYGIHLDGNSTVILDAAQDNKIVVRLIDDDADGINVVDRANGTITFNANGSNIIEATGLGTDGIYTDSGNNTKVDFTATNGSNEITAGNNGIDHRGDNNITLIADNGGNIIDAGNAYKKAEGDGVRIEGNGKVKLDGKYNSITASDTGLYIHKDSSYNADIELIARGTDEDNNGYGNYIESIYGSGVQNDDEKGKITVQADNSSNYIKGKVNAVYNNGSGNITIQAGQIDEDGVSTLADYEGVDNILTAGESGVRSDGTGTTNVIAANDNIIAGTTNGILSNDTGTIKVTAGNYNTIGQYTDESNVIHTSNTGINVTEGTIIVSSGNNTDIYGKVQGIYNKTGNITVNASGGITVKSEYKNRQSVAIANDKATTGLTGKTINVIADGMMAQGISNNNVGKVILTADNNITVNANGILVGYGIYTEGSANTELTNKKGLTQIIAEGSSESIGVIAKVGNKVGNSETKTTIDSKLGNIIQAGKYAVRSEGKEGTLIEIKTDEGSNILEAINSNAIFTNGGLVNLNAAETNFVISDEDSAIYTKAVDAKVSLTAKQNYITGVDGIENTINGSVELNAVGDNNMIFSIDKGIILENNTSSAKDAVSEVKLVTDKNNEIYSNDTAIYTIGTKTVNNAGKVLLDGNNNSLFADKTGIDAATRTIVELQADTANNIQVGNITEIVEKLDNVEVKKYFGDGLAIKAIDEGVVNLTSGDTNTILGAVYARGNKTSITLKGSENVNAQNKIYSYAAIADAGNLDKDTSGKFTGKDVYSALYAEDGAHIDVTGENYIGTYADSGNDKMLERTVWAYSAEDTVGSSINITGASVIGTDRYALSPNSADVAIAAGTATDLTKEDVVGFNGKRSTVTIEYDDFSDDTGSSISGDILSAYAGQVDIIAKTGSNAGITIEGNLLAGNNGILNVDLGNEGYLVGRIDDYQDAGTNNTEAANGHLNFYNPAFSSTIYGTGTVNLDMGTNSYWRVTGQSWVSSISGDNATIDMRNSNNADTTSHAVHVGTLTGNHTFVMDLNDANHNISDMLYIKDEANSSGIQTVYLNTVEGLENMQDGDKLRFATVNAGTEQLSFIGEYNGENGYSPARSRVMLYDTGFNNVAFEIGNETYSEADTENSGYNGASFNETKPGDAYVDAEYGDGATNWYITRNSSGDEISDAGKTMLNMSRANYSNAIYMDRLNKRLGEARYINSEEDEGMWVRIRHDRIGKDDAYRSQNTMYELGYDQKQECDNGERRVGFAIDYMHGDTGYDQIAGKGEIDRYGLWLYDTWMGDKGHYADYVAKWGHLSNDFEIYNSRSEVTGDYSNNVFSVSAEYGRKKDIGNDWYFEPQVQAQLARVTGADYTTSQGTKVSVDGINSLIGRAGFRLGKDFGEEKQSTVYIKADVLHEFLGDQDIRAFDGTTSGWQTVSYENEGTWYDVGLGFAAMMSKSSYAFLDLERSFGHDNDETYQINVGMQWSF